MKAKMEKIDDQWLKDHRWMLRTSHNGISFGGFKWNPIDEWTEAPDWKPTPSCGGGLHGITPHFNRTDNFVYDRFELCEIEGDIIPIDGDKVKVRRAKIVAINADIPPLAFKLCGIKVKFDPQTRNCTYHKDTYGKISRFDRETRICTYRKDPDGTISRFDPQTGNRIYLRDPDGAICRFNRETGICSYLKAPDGTIRRFDRKTVKEISKLTKKGKK